MGLTRNPSTIPKRRERLFPTRQPTQPPFAFGSRRLVAADVGKKNHERFRSSRPLKSREHLSTSHEKWTRGKMAENARGCPQTSGADRKEKEGDRTTGLTRNPSTIPQRRERLFPTRQPTQPPFAFGSRRLVAADVRPTLRVGRTGRVSHRLVRRLRGRTSG